MIEIRRLGAGDLALVFAAEHLFDGPVQVVAARRFLDSADHHLLLAFEHARPVGFVSGVEVTHPDKGTEMFVYELAVDESFRRQGIGKRLVNALADLAANRGCYGMWVGVDIVDNAAAVATYRSAGAEAPEPALIFNWTLPPRSGALPG
ncbi:MAG TPA: GNAT family N-acetyltransferase [Chloroflexota bacterium]|nr:GNAT family N-acetyltransferase [Chloroflexota bacterium]